MHCRQPCPKEGAAVGFTKSYERRYEEYESSIQ